MRSSAKGSELRSMFAMQTPRSVGRVTSSSSMIRLNSMGDVGSPCLTPRFSLMSAMIRGPDEMTVVESR